MAFIHDEYEEQKLQRAVFPPIINSVDFMGEVRETGSIRFPRDIGCSSTLGGLPIFLFGDTFEEQADSQAMGIASSTAAIGSYLSPNTTRYPSIPPETHPGVLELGESYSEQFIPFTSVEEEFNLLAQNLDGHGDRYRLRTYSPIVEVPNESVIGVVWFIKERTNDSNPEANEFCGVGIAEVEIRRVGVIGAECAEDVPVAMRYGDLLFDSSGPQWGNVATLLDGDYIYLYGTYHRQNRRCRLNTCPKTGSNAIGLLENPVFVCRVPYANRSYLMPELYTYWDGRRFSGAPSTSIFRTEDPHLEPVFFNILAGTVFHTTLFSDNEDGLFLIIGCDGSDNGKVRLKIAENPWGPWSGEGWLLDLGTEDRGYKGTKTCVYAHPWINLERNEMVLTWSEPWPGGVEMIKIGFKMVDESKNGSQEGEGQTICSNDTDSMFSDVDERLMLAIGGQQTFKEVKPGEDTDDNDLNFDEERKEARKRALAKLSGNTETEDFQKYLEHYKTHHGQFNSGYDIESAIPQIWGRNPFCDEPADSALPSEQVTDPSVGFDNRSEKSFDRESEDADRELFQTGHIENNPTRNGVRRVVGLFQGTWVAESPIGITKSRNSKEGSYEYELEGTSYNDNGKHNDSDEANRKEVDDDSQTMAFETDVETRFNATVNIERHSIDYSENMRADNLTKIFKLRVRNRGIGLEDSGESSVGEPNPVTDGERRGRMKWGSGAKLDVSMASKRKPRILPKVPSVPALIHSRSSSAASLDTDWAPTGAIDHHKPEHWQIHDRNSEPSIRAADEEIGVRTLGPSGRMGYVDRGYVTDFHGTYTQPPRTSSEDWQETWHENEGPSVTESQEPESDGQISGKSKNWLAAIKGSVQNLVPKALKRQWSGGDKPGMGFCQGLKKKFSEMSLSRQGKSVVNLRRIAKSEADLKKFVDEKNEENQRKFAKKREEAELRRFVEEQFDAGN